MCLSLDLRLAVARRYDTCANNDDSRFRALLRVDCSATDSCANNKDASNCQSRSRDTPITFKVSYTSSLRS